MKLLLTEMQRRAIRFGSLVCLCGMSAGILAQDAPPPRDPPPGGPGFRPGGGFGPPGGQEMKLVKKFDKDGNKRLDAAERKEAREYVVKERANRPGRGPGGPGGRGPGGFGGNMPAPEKGVKITPSEVKNYGSEPLYDGGVLRTCFLQFESEDWEKELVDFNNTDVEVPATLTVDGKSYKDVGVHTRGASSFGVGEGRKRSLNLTLDDVHDKQELGGYRTLNLMNSHTDPSFLRTVLYLHIARQYIPAPKANFVRVVINGENWGVYPNAQQFNKDFTRDFFHSTKGVRWKAPGSPRGRASLKYLGDNPEDYKSIYDIKTKDDKKSWEALITLCKTLNETPANQLVEKLSPMLDIDGTLKFLALEMALINNDGYWVRTSDYNLYLDEQGKFHFIPHDSNETFTMPGGPGFGRGPGGFGGPPPQGDRPRDGERNGPPREGGPRGEGPNRGGPPANLDLDPLLAANDPEKPLISKLLAVPELRAKYLSYVQDIARNWLDWEKLGPIAEKYRALIADEVKRDTRKLTTNELFERSLTGNVQANGEPRPGPGREPISIKAFAEKRREYLLNYKETKTSE